MDEKRGRFEAQVLPHLDAAYRFACCLSSPQSDADDILQEAILRAFRGFDTLRGTQVKAWLLAIVRNCYLTALKQQQKRAFVPLPEEDDGQDGHAIISTTPDPEGDSIRRDEGRTLDRLMAALPEEYREVLVLREIEDMGYREIAQVTNVPIGTVMSRLACPGVFEDAMGKRSRGRGTCSALRPYVFRLISTPKLMRFQLPILSVTSSIAPNAASFFGIWRGRAQ